MSGSNRLEVIGHAVDFVGHGSRRVGHADCRPLDDCHSSVDGLAAGRRVRFFGFWDLGYASVGAVWWPEVSLDGGVGHTSVEGRSCAVGCAIWDVCPTAISAFCEPLKIGVPGEVQGEGMVPPAFAFLRA